MIVGLTGGIGSGKSTVAAMFQELGVPVYVSDLQARELMNNSKEIHSQLQDLLGEEAVVNGLPDRVFIASKVFQDKALLSQLNQIVHPQVRTHFLQWTATQKAPYVIQESAILFESGGNVLCDVIITVTAPLEEKIARVMQRDGVSEEAVLQRMKNQLPDAEKAANSQFVIENINRAQTAENVAVIHQTLLKKTAEK